MMYKPNKIITMLISGKGINMTYLEDSYFIIKEEEKYLYLMHKVRRPEINSESKLCVGTALFYKGFWKVFVSKRDALRNDQVLVAVTSSRDLALKVLWNERNLMNWGYFQ